MCKSQALAYRRGSLTLLLLGLAPYVWVCRLLQKALSFQSLARSPLPILSDHVVYLKEAARCSRKLDCVRDKRDLFLQ